MTLDLRNYGFKKLLLTIIAALSLTLYIYVISTHRIKTFKDISSVLKTYSLPLHHNERCKIYNNTHFRCLPNVFLIGASKAGTTSLVSYLSQHPNITFVNRRIHKIDNHSEVHRFDRNTYGYAWSFLDLGDEWASCPLVSSVETVVIHYTPNYLYAPTVPFELRKFFSFSLKLQGEIKFLIMLRDPVARAWSSYWFHNSHLLHAEDRGSFKEFQDLAEEEIKRRTKFEQCMLKINSKPLCNITSVCDKTTTSEKLNVKKRYSHKPYLDSIFPILPCDETNQNPKSSVSCSTSEASRNKLFFNLKTCFGPQLFRSPLLGLRHIDKGVYIDQIYRWMVNFRITQFHLSTLEKFSSDPKKEFQKILRFLTVSSTSNYLENKKMGNSVSLDPVVDKIVFSRKRLEKPNFLSMRPDNNLSSPEKKEFLLKLKRFYSVYNEKLNFIFSTNF